MKLLLATHNEDKVKEHKNILKELDEKIEVYSLKEVNIEEEAEETADTLLGNALLKVESIHHIAGEKEFDYIVSEDFGFFVEAFPEIAGVHAKRWFEGTNQDRSKKIIELFKEVNKKNKTARYKTVLVAMDKKGNQIVAEGELVGEIGEQVVNKEGFAYDQILRMPDGRYLSEYSLEEKNQISSRRRAMEKLIERIKKEKNNI